MSKSTFFLLTLLFTTIGTSQESDLPELPKDSAIIKDNFKVLYSSVAGLASIDWNSLLDCYDMGLKSGTLNDFISIRFITRKEFYPGIEPLIKKLPGMKNILYKSYHYKYAETHNGITMQLHFIKTKSLSNHAKKTLKNN